MRVHRSELSPTDVEEVEDGVRITTVERTVRDVATLEKLADAVACLDAMVAAGVLTDEILGRVERSVTGRWGSRRVKRALPLVDGRAMSPPESWLRVAIHLSDLPHPVPQYEIHDSGMFLGKGDLAWPEAKLIVEYEGAYHFDDLQIPRDDRRYARLVAAGWRVIRVTAADLHDLDAVVARIRDALAVTAP
ncbi:endonuclease domain-containing protein [Blastococcus sp. SYSU D00669]